VRHEQADRHRRDGRPAGFRAIPHCPHPAGRDVAEARLAEGGARRQGGRRRTDHLLAPVALYPDQLLAQILLCSQKPGKVGALAEWMAGHESLKGTALQDAAVKSGFEASFVAIVVFPDVVHAMATQMDRTTRVGQAFTADRSAVFASVQRLRAQAQKVGTLKTTPSGSFHQTTSTGERIATEPPIRSRLRAAVTRGRLHPGPLRRQS
jgi:hypothetical protein